MRNLVILLLLLGSCSVKKDKEIAFNYKDYAVDSLTAIRDTVTFIKNTNSTVSSHYIVKNPVNDSSKGNIQKQEIFYPPSTKEIDWYYIVYNPTSGAMLTIICKNDRKEYQIPLKTAQAVAASGVVLQSGYVRFDTSLQKIFSYSQPLKGF